MSSSLPLTAHFPTTLSRLTGLTDGGEDAGEAEIVHSVERQQVEQELLSFFLKEQERVRFIQLPVWGQIKQLA